MNIRILARTIVFHNRKILLVRNKNENFWYPPGGEWNYENENILQAAAREVKEETGLNVKITKLLYLQEFHATPEIIFFETFWLAKPLRGWNLNKEHIDSDLSGKVADAKLFSEKEINHLKVFPQKLKNDFWKKIKELERAEDPFIGVN